MWRLWLVVLIDRNGECKHSVRIYRGFWRGGVIWLIWICWFILNWVFQIHGTVWGLKVLLVDLWLVAVCTFSSVSCIPWNRLRLCSSSRFAYAKYYKSTILWLLAYYSHLFWRVGGELLRMECNYNDFHTKFPTTTLEGCSSFWITFMWFSWNTHLFLFFSIYIITMNWR